MTDVAAEADVGLVVELADRRSALIQERGLLVRPFATDAMRRANELVAGWMHDSGMAVRRGTIGNLIGRYEADAVRERAAQSLRDRAQAIAAARGGECRWQVRQETPTVPTDPELTALLARAVEELGYPVERLPSGAGHDAAQMAALTPIAMLFVRCKEGMSHNPPSQPRKKMWVWRSR